MRGGVEVQNRPVIHSRFTLQSRLGQPIHGDLRLPEGPGPHPVVVVCHGFKGFKDWGFHPWLGARLAGRGPRGRPLQLLPQRRRARRTATSRTSTPSGATRSPSSATTSTRSSTPSSRGGSRPTLDPSRLALLGHSRGGGIALLGAAERPEVKALATWAAVSHFDRIADEATLAEWRRTGVYEVVNARTGQIAPDGGRLPRRRPREPLPARPPLGGAARVRPVGRRPRHGGRDGAVRGGRRARRGRARRRASLRSTGPATPSAPSTRSPGRRPTSRPRWRRRSTTFARRSPPGAVTDRPTAAGPPCPATARLLGPPSSRPSTSSPSPGSSPRRRSSGRGSDLASRPTSRRTSPSSRTSEARRGSCRSTARCASSTPPAVSAPSRTTSPTPSPYYPAIGVVDRVLDARGTPSLDDLHEAPSHASAPLFAAAAALFLVPRGGGGPGPVGRTSSTRRPSRRSRLRVRRRRRQQRRSRVPVGRARPPRHRPPARGAGGPAHGDLVGAGLALALLSKATAGLLVGLAVLAVLVLTGGRGPRATRRRFVLASSPGSSFRRSTTSRSSSATGRRSRRSRCRPGGLRPIGVRRRPGGATLAAAGVGRRHRRSSSPRPGSR